jgi:hypothetical protein
MLAFYRDTFASQARTIKRIAVEGGLQRAVSVSVMQELFSMA